MKAEFINPFLESAKIVIEQVVQIRPTTGQLGMKDVQLVDGFLWIQIGIHGQVTGNIMFGLSENVALKMVSAMMGGYALSEIDDIVRSGISELGNMISGNASTMLFNQGVRVEITPPVLLRSDETGIELKQALTIPLIMDGIGELDIQVLIAS